jgi:hypothetical protein
MTWAQHQLSLLEDPIEVQFQAFHHAHPEVYEQLHELALELRNQGHRRCGIGMLFEVLRWTWMRSGIRDEDGFRLNNNYRSRYARLLMANDPRLAGFFETRALHEGAA